HFVGHPTISADGTQVAFADQLQRSSDVLEQNVYLSSGGPRILISHSLSSPSQPGRGRSITPEISTDGQIVSFTSLADDLVEHDFNFRQDAFLYNRSTGAIAPASRPAVP